MGKWEALRSPSLTMDRPMPRYENMVLASSFEAPRTVMRLLLFSSYSRHCARDQAGMDQRRCMHEPGPMHATVLDAVACPLPPACLLPQVSLPKLAVCGSSGHGSQQVRVDLDHLLHRLGGCMRQVVGRGESGSYDEG
jgi:hypothetical protein